MNRFPLLAALPTAAALLIAASGCSSKAAAPPDEPAATVTDAGVVQLPANSPMLAHIKRAPVALAELPTAQVIAPGKIETNPNRLSKIVLPVTGRIVEVFVKVGDGVKKDQPLLTIQSPDADAAISGFLSAEAALTQSQAGLTKAQADDERAKDLFDHNAIARKEVLTADSLLAQATASLNQARAAREQASRRLAVLGLTPGESQQLVVLRSPLSGKVLDLSVVQGEFRNDANAALMTIADLSTVWVTSQVPESYIRFVQVGERVAIRLVAYPNETFDGRVSRIADTVDPQTRTVKVQAEMENPTGRFRPEMFGSIHHIESTAKVMVVPFAALIEGQARTTVFVETAPGRFEQRTIEVGQREGDVVRVTGGLSAGDVVVVDGGMLLQGLVKRS
jgi:cobalt-zinc-cadmium efflux system membrane fusion protein